MADQRGGGISWTEETWNPIRGCSRVSEGCRHCYAERVAARFSGPGQPYHGLAEQTPAGPRWTGRVGVVADHLRDPLRWRRPRLVFVNSMSDLFHRRLTFEQIDQVVAVMAMAQHHTFQVLTKRPERMAEYLARRAAPGGRWASKTLHKAAWKLGRSDGLFKWPLPNVWWGTSAENQQTLDARMPALMACRQHAAVLWLSAEPLLGPMDLVQRNQRGALTIPGRDLDWIVAGGESGPGARPMDPDWPRALRDQCAAVNVPFHFKQWGEWLPDDQRAGSEDWPMNAAIIEDFEVLYWRVGKKMAGRLLDGTTHDDMPAEPVER